MTCKACGSDRVREFYEVRGIPVHSCLMMETRDEALSYPTGDLVLGFCEDCGFVENVVFDPSVHEYSTRYEETQAFSKKFNEFVDRLCYRLLDNHDLYGPEVTVVEIGCGKGEFLVRLCELGGCRGIGIDPGYRPERTKSPAAERIEFIQDFYGEKYAHLTGDLICCRHTLEHIADVRGFVSLIARSLGGDSNPLVFFEVPDVLRVLEEQAFWDVYYEHCSYFSLGSLARLFRRCGFAIDELWTDYDDQYLMLVGHAGGDGAWFECEDDLERLRRAVARFESEVPRARRHWRRLVDDAHRAGKKVTVWGSGSKAVAWLTTLGIRDEIEYVVDINPHKWGKFLAGTGHEIVAPEALTEYQPDLILVMNPIYVDEIRADCERLGVGAELLAV